MLWKHHNSHNSSNSNNNNNHNSSACMYVSIYTFIMNLSTLYSEWLWRWRSFLYLFVFCFFQFLVFEVFKRESKCVMSVSKSPCVCGRVCWVKFIKIVFLGRGAMSCHAKVKLLWLFVISCCCYCCCGSFLYSIILFVRNMYVCVSF